MEQNNLKKKFIYELVVEYFNWEDMKDATISFKYEVKLFQADLNVIRLFRIMNNDSYKNRHTPLSEAEWYVAYINSLFKYFMERSFCILKVPESVSEEEKSYILKLKIEGGNYIEELLNFQNYYTKLPLLNNFNVLEMFENLEDTRLFLKDEYGILFNFNLMYGYFNLLKEVDITNGSI